MAASMRKVLSGVRDFLRNDDQAHVKVAAFISSIFVAYVLNKLEVNLVYFSNYLVTHYSSVLVFLGIAALFSLIALFQYEILKLIDKSKDIDSNILNAIGASFCFFTFGMLFIYFFGNSQINQLNSVKNFDLAQFKLDFNEKFYLDNDLVTGSHIKDLRKNFNSIIKAVHKNIKQDSKSDDASSPSDKLFIDGDIIALYSYLEKTLPLYLVNEEEVLASAQREPSKIQYVVSIILLVTSVYLVAKALLAQIIHEVYAQMEANKPQTVEMVEVEETIDIGPDVTSLVSLQPENEVAQEPVETVEVSIQTDLVEEAVESKMQMLEARTEVNLEEEEVKEPVAVEQIVVEYCLNCERQKHLDENREEEEHVEKRDITPYRTHNPFKKSVQNLNRTEMTQMSYPGGSSYDELHQADDEEFIEQPYEQLVGEDEGQMNYVDEEMYGDEQEQEREYQEEAGEKEYGDEEGYISEKEVSFFKMVGKLSYGFVNIFYVIRY